MKKWMAITLGSSLAIAGGCVIAFGSISSKITTSVLSYQLLSISDKGMKFRLVFGFSNNSRIDLELSNQKYDVFVSGYKLAQITSQNRYKLMNGNTSLVPLDVEILWKDLNLSAPYIGTQLQVNTISDLPLVVHGRLSAKFGAITLSKIPVRWAGKIGYFIP